MRPFELFDRGDGWVAFSERLPEPGDFVELYDQMFDQVCGPYVVSWNPANTDGDFTAWRLA